MASCANLVQVIANVSRRYRASPAVIAIEVLNEAQMPPLELLDYYRRAYDAVRQGGMDAARVAVVINIFMTGDILREVHAWHVHGVYGMARGCVTDRLACPLNALLLPP